MLMTLKLDNYVGTLLTYSPAHRLNNFCGFKKNQTGYALCIEAVVRLLLSLHCQKVRAIKQVVAATKITWLATNRLIPSARITPTNINLARVLSGFGLIY